MTDTARLQMGVDVKEAIHEIAKMLSKGLPEGFDYYICALDMKSIESPDLTKGEQLMCHASSIAEDKLQATLIGIVLKMEAQMNNKKGLK